MSATSRIIATSQTNRQYFITSHMLMQHVNRLALMLSSFARKSLLQAVFIVEELGRIRDSDDWIPPWNGESRLRFFYINGEA